MGTENPRATISFDEDLYDEVIDAHEETGQTKSRIVNDHLRNSLEASDNWFMRSFGQALFVVGFVLAYYQAFTVGLGVSFVGLGLMFWIQMQEHKRADRSYLDAFRRTLGVS